MMPAAAIAAPSVMTSLKRRCDCGKHAEHHRVQTLRGEHFSAGVCERSGPLNWLIRGDLANDPRDRGDQRIGICTCVNEKAAAIERTLFKGVVNGERRLWND